MRRHIQPSPSPDRVRELLALDVETGVFTWKVSRGRCPKGQVAGCREGRWGYILLRIDDVLYAAHDLVWLLVNDEWCPRQIDHRDRNPSNNAPSNLRKATQQQNLQNKSMQSNNTSGFRGVYWHKKTGTWAAQVEKRVNGRRVNIVVGRFPDKLAAANAARMRRLELFGEFAPTYDLSE